MKALSAFLPWVVPHAYGVTDPYAEQAVRDACIDLCAGSDILQTIDAYGVTSNDPEFSLPMPPQLQLVRVLRVTYNDQPLAPAAADAVWSGAAMRAGVDTTVAPVTGTPTTYYQSTPSDSRLYLWPVPASTAAGVLGVRASFAPTRSATQVDDIMFDQWLPEVVSGALAKLLTTKGQPFYDPTLGTARAKEFAAGVARAAAEARRGATRGPLRVVPRSKFV